MELQEGIILKTIDYQENSKLVYIMTKTGLKSAIARGAKKIKSHNYAYTQSLTHIAFALTKERYLTNGKVLTTFKSIYEDTNKMISILKIIEITYVLGEHINDYLIFFDFLLQILKQVDLSLDFCYYEMIFKIKTLYLLGVAPVFSHCVVCQKQKEFKGFAFNSGGMKCLKCSDQNEFFYPQEVIEQVKLLYFTKLNALISKYSLLNIDVKRVDRFLELYYDQYLGFKSKVDNFLTK